MERADAEILSRAISQTMFQRNNLWGTILFFRFHFFSPPITILFL
ncbi:hypothetical protein EPIR_2200 [Erwinia piriflorinigrans CFBP 5888]|uniref:Uncharacterized protein n=1 Tax=Erwinia piriflorinigrans CFBP 5888 TaxID=1161919 RepID=V5Z9F3_9GAMM|nr:hypothetical protein EPIR_2200 [Erwinia piriflorinigrans CFBP 5888]